MIDGYFQPDYDMRRPYVTAVVWLDHLSSDWRPVPFVVDTGSTYSCIHPRDAADLLDISTRMLLDPPPGWPPVTPLSGVGGSGG
ncbi:MAG: hypothetical protein ACRDHF_15100 [Tepidiformaceae bacterium]